MVGEGEPKMVVHLEGEGATLEEEAAYFLFRQEGVGVRFVVASMAVVQVFLVVT